MPSELASILGQPTLMVSRTRKPRRFLELPSDTVRRRQTGIISAVQANFIVLQKENYVSVMA